MRLVLLGSRYTVLRKNNDKRDLREIWKDKKIDYDMNEIINKFLFYEK